MEFLRWHCFWHNHLISVIKKRILYLRIDEGRDAVFFVRLKEIKMPYYNKNIFGNPEIQFTTNWLCCWDWNYRENFNLNSLRIELSLKIIFSAFSYRRNKIRFKSNDRNYSVAKTRYHPFWKIIRFPEIARKFPRLLSISQR